MFVPMKNDVPWGPNKIEFGSAGSPKGAPTVFVDPEKVIGTTPGPEQPAVTGQAVEVTYTVPLGLDPVDGVTIALMTSMG
jgi:hypothetical protein